MRSTRTLILGGGLAGLSTARHLGRRGDWLLVEKEDKVGGRAGSVRVQGFTFDHTGHLLHLHDPQGKRLILGLLAGNSAPHERSSWIRSHGTCTRYPFQANTYGLPERVTAECVAGFMKNVHRPQPMGAAPSFEEWCLKTFGKGICRHFMFPYNRKLWRRPLSELTTEWQGRFLPKPTAEEVLYGALTDQRKFFGYNAFFRYPLRGGIQALPDAMAEGLSGIRVRSRVVSVDLRERVACVQGLGEVRYERLVNTLPLPEFLDLAGPLPGKVREARKKLRWVSVLNLNLGVARPRVSDKHWIYFPEPGFVFYRVGFCSNFSKTAAPPGTSSMYIEVARGPRERADKAELERLCLRGLKSCGILKDSDKLAARLWIDIPCAYVVYDRQRPAALAAIFRHLSSNGVESIGRWGAWKYSFMEETILDGRSCALRLLGRSARKSVPQAPLVPLR
ncbi:MAG: FAD-dependent oxidoreductase [Elusimicrobiota bacterium]